MRERGRKRETKESLSRKEILRERGSVRERERERERERGRERKREKGIFINKRKVERERAKRK